MCLRSRPYALCNSGVHFYYYSPVCRPLVYTCHDTVHTVLDYLLGTLPSGWVEYYFCVFLFLYIFFSFSFFFSLLFFLSFKGAAG